jgi:hypothetical protein
MTKTMASIRDNAKNYVSKQTKNISELKSVPVELNLFEGKGKDKDGKEFNYSYIEVDGEEYRVPDSVLKSLKAILERKPTLKTFSVTKQGSGLNTEYTVIPLD